MQQRCGFVNTVLGFAGTLCGEGVGFGREACKGAPHKEGEEGHDEGTEGPVSSRIVASPDLCPGFFMLVHWFRLSD